MEHLDAYTAKLDAYLDDELKPEDREAVRAHLETCPDCRAYVEELTFIRSVLPDAEDTPVPDDFTAGVMAVIRADAVPQRKPLRFYLRRFVPIAACLAILVGVVRMSSHYNWSQQTSVVADSVDTTPERASSPTMETAPPNEISAEEFPNAEPNAAIKGARSGLFKSADIESSTPPAITSYGITADDVAPNPADYAEWLELTNVEVGNLLDDVPPLTSVDGKTYYALSYTDFQSIVNAVNKNAAGSNDSNLPPNTAAEPESTLCCIVVTAPIK